MQHLGVTPGGCMDLDLFSIANALVKNSSNEGVLEFAYQGPLLKLINGKTKIAINVNVLFQIIKSNNETIILPKPLPKTQKTTSNTSNTLNKNSDSILNQSLEIVRKRIDESGTKEPLIQRSGKNRILLQLPGVKEPERIKDLL